MSAIETAGLCKTYKGKKFSAVEALRGLDLTGILVKYSVFSGLMEPGKVQPSKPCLV